MKRAILTLIVGIVICTCTACDYEARYSEGRTWTDAGKDAAAACVKWLHDGGYWQLADCERVVAGAEG